MSSLSSYETKVDELIEVRERVRRRRRRVGRWMVPTLTVEWAAIRVSVSHRFLNGRRRLDETQTYNYDTWYSGTARSKRSARRAMAATIARDQVRVDG